MASRARGTLPRPNQSEGEPSLAFGKARNNLRTNQGESIAVVYPTRVAEVEVAGHEQFSAHLEDRSLSVVTPWGKKMLYVPTARRQRLLGVTACTCSWDGYVPTQPALPH
ncbi:hypothetical protein CISG_05114 [Coccidioides immitis RMSCC 3703]|uniref:Uncharacterized protein n=1 Tax=Coccidioides immitis RMSCC 3703 TaxID=454286 RepID=A0A0J8QTU6_COCIT|nr:hypothetical protein CISG_05114 [Coccidioides immitis RMSCC 3703]